MNAVVAHMAVAYDCAEPPHSLEAEQAVLGGLMLDNSTWKQVVDRLTEEDFYRQDHRLIYRSITQRLGEGQPADAVTLADWLTATGKLEEAGGLAYLATLARDTPTAANVGAYAGIVREKAALRRLILASTELAEAAFAPGGRTAVEIVAQHVAKVIQEAPQASGLKALALSDFLARELPPRQSIIEPWLPAQGLAMIYAPRGTGKTHVSLGIAFAVATGGTFLRWKAPIPQGVLFIDGELPAHVLQTRLAMLIRDSAEQPLALLDIVTPDFQTQGIPDLGSERGQAALDAILRPDHRLIVLDNLSALVRSGKENEGESWLPVQTWALRQRAAGRSVLFIHHAGKGGQQRGSSRREDLLDTVIALRRPSDYTPQDGASFEVHFEKARMLHGETVAPFEARLAQDQEGRGVWTMQDLTESTFERVVTLSNDGLRPGEIAEELGIHKSRVSRHLKRAREEGRIGADRSATGSTTAKAQP